VIEAPDGPAGLNVLNSNARVDLLITDVGLPNGLNGRQVADAARVSRPNLKVLFITGYAENAAVGNDPPPLADERMRDTPPRPFGRQFFLPARTPSWEISHAQPGEAEQQHRHAREDGQRQC